MKKYLFFICCLICCQCVAATINLLPADKDTIVYDTIAWQPIYEFGEYTFFLPSYKEFPGKDSIDYIIDIRNEDLCVNHKLQLIILAPTSLDSIMIDCDSVAVDLGLSVKWAPYNVGATKPEGYGYYFAWGEVIPKGKYDWSTYQYCKGTNKTITKYCSNNSYGYNGFIDNKAVLDLEDDAATINWGGSWRMPTDDEFTELREKCRWIWTTQNGVNGYNVIGPNNNSIFLPTTGYMDNMNLKKAGSNGYYWSSSLYSKTPYYAYHVCFDSNSVIQDYDDGRYYGFSVRPVCPKTNENNVINIDSVTICYGEKYNWNGEEYFVTGEYIDTLQSVAGRDSIVLLSLTVLPQVIGSTEVKVIRLGESYIWHGLSYSGTGIYIDTLQNALGCDSIVSLNLTVLQPVYGVEESILICDGECYTWQDVSYCVAGTYKDTLRGVSGCDSIVTLHLTVNYSDTTEFSATTCNSYTWNTEVYTTSGDYVQTLQNVYGCDSVVTLHLTVNYSDTIEITEVACYCYTWTNGETYTESGTYYDSLTTIQGCDSIRILHLTILPIYYYEDTAVILEGDIYQWRGKSYTESGVYFDSLLTEAGCDSIYSLILEVEKKVILHKINIAEQCAGSGVMDVELLIQSGIADTILFEFTQNALDAGFINVVLSYEELMQLAYEDIGAGKYGVKLSGRYRGLVVFEEQVELIFLYPTTVMRKRWDDVLAVLTHDYNGGYNFVDFQWYKNGTVMPGATHSYIAEPLIIGTEYSVLLTEDNGLQLMSCPFVIDAGVGILDPTEQVDILLYPTLLLGTQKVICKVSEDAVVYIYDMIGNLIYEIQVKTGESELEMPYVAGAYMAKIITITNKERNIKLIVQ